MSKLAVLGGDPVIDRAILPYVSMSRDERAAVTRVVDSGCLSGFYGSPGPEFWGGPEVLAFEQKWAESSSVAHAVSVNSATSGLVAAMGAIGLGPGDEVIVPPWTMSATVVAPLFYGAIPVFADIEPDTFCLDPEAVRSEISERTRAIIAVNLFGQPAALAKLRVLADAHQLALIEDSAQAPLAYEDGRRCGTVGDIGIFSLNYHKHIHTGEGGICVTNNADLASRLQLIRNHGENAVEWLNIEDITNLVGLNLRMTELSAAIGSVQLDNIETHVAQREQIALKLSNGVRDLDGVTPPVIRTGCRHNFYCWVVRYDAEQIGVSRATFSAALKAEGVPHFVAYLPPLYTLPIFRRRLAIGPDGFPFNLSNRTYQDGLCPITERLHAKEAILFEPCAWDVDDETANKLVEAFRKVHHHRDELATAEASGTLLQTEDSV